MKSCCSCACCAAPLWCWCGFVHTVPCWSKVMFRGGSAEGCRQLISGYSCCYDAVDGWKAVCNLWDALRVVGPSVSSESMGERGKVGRIGAG